MNVFALPGTLICIFLVLLTIVLLLWGHVYGWREEHFNSVMTDTASFAYGQFEDTKCKVVFDILGKEADNYDVVKNYILLNYPGSSSECYVKSTDDLVDQNCSKANPGLYNDNYRDVVADIYPKLLQDPYVSKSLPQDVCVIKFAGENNNKDVMKEFVANMDESIPKLQAIRHQIAGDREQTKHLKSVKENKQSELEKSASINAQITTDISKLDANISDLNQKLQQRKAQVADLNTKLDGKRQQYATASKLVVVACNDANYGQCVNFPVGIYNTHLMEMQGLPNDSLSSIKVPPGLVARLYSDNLDVNGETTSQNKFIDIDGRNIPFMGTERWSDGTNNPGLNDSVSAIVVSIKPFA